MTGTTKQFSIWAACMVASLAAAFAAAGASRANSDAVRCEIAAAKTGGGAAIEALAHADHDLTGTYRLKVSGNGARIDQGGEFDARAGTTATLGSVMLGGSGSSYDVRLEVKASGKTVTCTERVGGWL